jgi:hypothetical protein
MMTKCRQFIEFLHIYTMSQDYLAISGLHFACKVFCSMKFFSCYLFAIAVKVLSNNHKSISITTESFTVIVLGVTKINHTDMT